MITHSKCGESNASLATENGSCRKIIAVNATCGNDSGDAMFAAMLNDGMIFTSFGAPKSAEFVIAENPNVIGR